MILPRDYQRALKQASSKISTRILVLYSMEDLYFLTTAL